jgi:hypothetical protein
MRAALTAVPRAEDQTDVPAKAPAGAASRLGRWPALPAAGWDLLDANRLDTGRPDNPRG